MPLVNWLFLSCRGSRGNAKAVAMPKIMTAQKPRYIEAGVRSYSDSDSRLLIGSDFDSGLDRNFKIKNS